MSASDHLSPQQGALTYYHGTSGQYEFTPGDILTPGAKPTIIGGRAKHVYYTSDLESAGTYATSSYPEKENGRVDWDADPVPGHVYAVQPETKTGRKLGRHTEDPWSGVPGNKAAFRTTGRLRVLHEVDRKTGRPTGA